MSIDCGIKKRVEYPNIVTQIQKNTLDIVYVGSCKENL